MLQKLEQAIKLAEAYRREEGQDDGIVLVYAGQVYGWKTSCVIRSQSAPERWPSALTAACGLPLAATTKTGPRAGVCIQARRGRPLLPLWRYAARRHPAQQSFIVPSKKGGLLQ